jgi:flagellar basal-body rod protein FlgB
MRWLQARSRVVAENIANADTPGFKPSDLREQGQGSDLVTTSARHIGGASPGQPAVVQAARTETRPGGNAVSLEDEMLKLSGTQLEYQMLAGLYQRSFALLRTAIGKRG